MADTSLTPKDLLSLVSDIIELVRISIHHRIDLFERDEINKVQLEHISNLEVRLLNVANLAANSAINDINTDLKNAAQVLGNTTNDLRTVINELKSFNQFIETLANLINIFSKISQAVAGGTPAIISALVQQLNNIGSTGTVATATRSLIATPTLGSIAGDIDEI